MTVGVLIAFILLSPGFCIAYAMRAFSWYDLKVDTQNNTSQLFFLVIISALLQSIAIPLYLTYIEYRFGLRLTEIIFTGTEFLVNKTNNEFYWKRWLALLAYLPCVYFLCGIAGFWIIRRVETGKWNFKHFHGAMYDVIKANKAPTLMCSVLTKTQHENCHVMYRGVLKEISYVSKNKIDYVWLSIVSKYLLHIDAGNKKLETHSKSLVSYFPPPTNTNKAVPELLYIKGEEIANLLITKVPPFRRSPQTPIGVMAIIFWSLLGLIIVGFLVPPFLKVEIAVLETIFNIAKFGIQTLKSFL